MCTLYYSPQSFEWLLSAASGSGRWQVAGAGGMATPRQHVVIMLWHQEIRPIAPPYFGNSYCSREAYSFTKSHVVRESASLMSFAPAVPSSSTPHLPAALALIAPIVLQAPRRCGHSHGEYACESLITPYPLTTLPVAASFFYEICIITLNRCGRRDRVASRCHNSKPYFWDILGHFVHVSPWYYTAHQQGLKSPTPSCSVPSLSLKLPLLSI